MIAGGNCYHIKTISLILNPIVFLCFNNLLAFRNTTHETETTTQKDFKQDWFITFCQNAANGCPFGRLN
jgi:hypothetical protein